MSLTCDAGGVHSVDLRALNGGISGIFSGVAVLVVVIELAPGTDTAVEAAAAGHELWLLFLLLNGGISGIWIGCEAAFGDAFLRKNNSWLIILHFIEFCRKTEENKNLLIQGKKIIP